MSRRLVLALAAGAALAAPAPAAAQWLAYDGEPPRRQTTMPLSVGGAITVDFQGHEASCAAAGMCGVSGTISLAPEGADRLTLLEFDGRRPVVLAFAGAALRTRVRRTGADGATRTCTDARQLELPLVGAFGSDGYVPFSPRPARGAAESLVATRCAGPLGRDLGPALPSAVLHVRAVRRGSAELDLGGERAFTAGGFTGTVRSTLRVRLGRARTTAQPSDDGGPAKSPPAGFEGRRMRVLLARYAVEAVEGAATLEAAVAGDPFPCSLLDACGLSASVRVTPAIRAGRLIVVASAPAARRTRRQLAASLGLRPGRAAPGIERAGYGAWGGRGTVAATARHADGTVCRSDAPLLGGVLTVRVAGDRLLAAWRVPSDAVRTRCPGPGAAELPASGTLLRASLPLAALRKRVVELRLTRGVRLRSEAYAGDTGGDVTLRLRRERVRQRLETHYGPR